MVDLPCQMFKGWRGSDKKDLVELYRIPPNPISLCFEPCLGEKEKFSAALPVIQSAP